jgi:hypothetical protein
MTCHECGHRDGDEQLAIDQRLGIFQALLIDDDKPTEAKTECEESNPVGAP